MNGTGRKFRGKHDVSIARSLCTCRHTFLCNTRIRVTLVLPPFLAAGRCRRPQWVQAHPGCGCHPLAGRNHGGHDGEMSFFDGVPSAEPVPPWSQRPWDPPEAAFPGVVPFRTLVLARAERAAVAVTGLSGD